MNRKSRLKGRDSYDRKLFIKLKAQLKDVEKEPTPAAWSRVHQIITDDMRQRIAEDKDEAASQKQDYIREFWGLVCQTADRIEPQSAIASETASLMRCFAEDEE